MRPSTCAASSSARPRRRSSATRYRGLDPVNCTPQLGVPGPWYDRLPHFRMGFTPSSGEEIQSRVLRRARGTRRAAIAGAARSWATRSGPLLQVSEIRTIAADELWMSPQYGQDTRRHPLHLDAATRRRSSARSSAVEAALAPFDAAAALGQAVPRSAGRAATSAWPTSRALAERLDPRGAFRNAWTDALFSTA